MGVVSERSIWHTYIAIRPTIIDLYLFYPCTPNLFIKKPASNISNTIPWKLWKWSCWCLVLYNRTIYYSNLSNPYSTSNGKASYRWYMYIIIRATSICGCLAVVTPKHNTPLSNRFCVDFGLCTALMLLHHTHWQCILFEITLDWRSCINTRRTYRPTRRVKSS